MKMSHYQFDPKEFTVLAIDDTPANLMILVEFLNQEGFRVLTASNGQSGIQRAIHGKPDIILLDVMMPNMDGFETCIKLKSDPQTQSVPVIFMTALNDTRHKVRGFEVGGVDYIPKPFEQAELLARLQTHLTNNRLILNLDQEVVKRTNELHRSLVREQDLRQSLAVALNKEQDLNKLKSSIIATISHELRTPLNAIIGYSEVVIEEIEEEDDLDSCHVEDIRRIRQSGHHLLKIINGILDLSKLEANKMNLIFKDFDVQLFVDDLVGAISPLMIKQGNALKIDNRLTINTIRSDKLKVRQILLNFLTNAAKFTMNGLVTLSFYENADGDVCLAVKDTGIGISKENHAMIFDSFRQVEHSMSRSYDGTGLGLAICKQFAELLEGHIEIESELDQGSIFTLILPITQEPAENLAALPVFHEQE
ncbi:MAG: hybrid sensor histidine kinase/response regulator [Anaerolineae bacterium]